MCTFFVDLLSFMEKNRYRKLLQRVALYDENDSSTWDGFDPKKTTMRNMYEKCNLGKDVMDFTGHALALYRTDE